MIKQILKNIGVVVFGLIVLFAASQVSAWTAPTGTPPANNVVSPLNIGTAGQSKAGGLILNSGGAANGLLVQSGNVGIGTLTPSAKLQVNGQIFSSSGGIKFPDGTTQTTAVGSAYTACDWSGWNITPPPTPTWPVTCKTCIFTSCEEYYNLTTTSAYCSGGKLTEVRITPACCSKCAPDSW